MSCSIRLWAKRLRKDWGIGWRRYGWSTARVDLHAGVAPSGHGSDTPAKGARTGEPRACRRRRCDGAHRRAGQVKIASLQTLREWSNLLEDVLIFNSKFFRVSGILENKIHYIFLRRVLGNYWILALKPDRSWQTFRCWRCVLFNSNCLN